MQSQSLSKQILEPQRQEAIHSRRSVVKYHELLAKLQQQPFYDDSLFFDKRSMFHGGNLQSKKFKTIYNKIILSNKSDPLHPSSYRKLQSNQYVRYNRHRADLLQQREKNQNLKIELNYMVKPKGDLLESIKSKFSNKQQGQNMRDRKRFFRNLMKKFTQQGQEDTYVPYKQRAHLFKKIFQYYKIKPQEKDHFEEMLKKLSERDFECLALSSKISTKMNLESRRNNNSVSERRIDQTNNPRLRILDKAAKTSHQRRTPNDNHRLQMLSVQTRYHPKSQDFINIVTDSEGKKQDQKKIKDLEKELSSRNQDYNTVQQDTKKVSYQTHTQHRTRILEKKINLTNLNHCIRQQTPVDIKLQKFREFLYAINFGNHIFVPLEVEKYQTTFKIYVGNGNNSNLIKAIFKKRFWFELTKNINQAHLIWTQLKQEHIFSKQIPKQYTLMQTQMQKPQDIQVNKTFQKHNLQTQLQKSNSEQNQSNLNLKIVSNLEADPENKQKILQKSNILDFKSLKLKQRPNVSRFISVQSERVKRCNHKVEKASKQSELKQNSIKLKKHPQLLILKNSTLLTKDPLDKILSSDQINNYNRLYSKYLKNSYRNYETKMPTFEERKKDIMLTLNCQIIKEQEKQNILIHNHLPFNGILGNKKAMFYILKEYFNLIGKDLFGTVPLTFHIKQGLKDEQYKKFAQQFQNRKKSNKVNYWVMKPGQFSNRGNGIECTNKIQQIRKRIQACAGKIDTKRPRAPLSTKSIILQSYITDLLLYNGRKFDIRTYMMITIMNGKIKAYWYEEGYIRTSSYIWNLSQIQDRQVHLTNDAVQKYSDTYGKYEPGNKLSYRDIQRYLQTYQKASKNVMYDKIIPQMKEIAELSLKASYLFLDPAKLQNNFEIFGFDFMLDSKLKPWLIEINTNPCLELGCPILERIIPNMLENAFRIAIDPLFPPPSSFSSNYKYNIAENAVNYNKFELIFDEDTHGPEIKKLYQSKSLQEILVKIEDIQQDKETFEEDGQQIDLAQQL